MKDTKVDDGGAGLPDWVCMGENLIDLDKSDPMHLTTGRECKKHQFSGGCSLPQADLIALIKADRTATIDRLVEAFPKKREWDEADADSLEANMARAFNSAVNQVTDILLKAKEEVGDGYRD